MTDFMRLVPKMDAVDPETGETGWERVDRLNAEDAERERDEAEERTAARRRLLVDSLVKSGASRRHLEIERPHMTEAMRALTGFFITPGRGGVLVLAGGVGVGKTVASALWLASCSSGKVWYSTSAAFARASRYVSPQPWELADCGVLDDLGTEFKDTKGSFQTDLDELIAHYEAQDKRLVITTNLLKDDFKRDYDKRIASRVRGSGGFVVVGGCDLRRPTGNP